MRLSRRTEAQPARRLVRFAAGGLLLLLCLAFSAPAAAATGNTSVGIRITSWPVGPAQAHVAAVTDSEMPAELAATASTSGRTGKPVTCGGTCGEYVARSGHEAPGVHA